MTDLIPTRPPETDVESTYEFLGLYTEEDMALKMHLSGLQVTDLNASETHPRPVPVWFLNPEREERRITYPSITINFMSERVAHEREHRGLVPVLYHYLQDVAFDDPVIKDYPLPMDLDYQVTTHARINQHHSQISSTLAMGPLHPRFAQLGFPGGTVRRLEVLAMTTNNGQEADKRIFRHVYRVRIPTEIEFAVAMTNPRVRAIVLRIFDTVSGQQVAGPRRTITSTPGSSTLRWNQGMQYQSEIAAD